MATVVVHRKFSCTKLGNNNNKYWNVTLYDNDDVMSEWGRQGKTKQSKTWHGVGRSFMEKKIAEKDKKGYHEKIFSCENDETCLSKTEFDKEFGNHLLKENIMKTKLYIKTLEGTDYPQLIYLFRCTAV